MKLKEVQATLELTDTAKVRVFEDDDGEYWFPAKQVVEALGKTWSGHILETIPFDEWVMQCKITTHDSDGRRVKRKTTLINENAFVVLAMGSKHPEAKELIRAVTEYVKNARRGTLTQKHTDDVRREAQLTFGFFTAIKDQRQMNHRYNLKPKGPNGLINSEFWNRFHRYFTGMDAGELRTYLCDKYGVPSEMAERSVIDAYRYHADTFGISIASAEVSHLTDLGESQDDAMELVKEGLAYLMKLGRVVAKHDNTKQEYEQRQSRWDIRQARAEAQDHAEAYIQRRQMKLFGE